MKEIHDLLSGFKTLKEYTEFMNMLAEKQTSGQEIARGMDKHDKSKKQKDTFVSKEVKKHANGGATETHYDQRDASLDMPPPEPPPPPPMPIPPGQQVVIGNKKIDPAQLTPQTVTLNISGEKDNINLKPKFDKNPNKAM